MDKILEILFIRAGLATAVGFMLEFLVTIFATVLFHDVAAMQWFVGDHDGITSTMLITAAVFHVIGWIIVSKDWKALSSGGARPANTFRFEQDGYVFEGIVHPK